MNAKNRLKELLEDRGLRLEEAATFHNEGDGFGGWTSRVTVDLPTGEVLTGGGSGRRASFAQVLACDELLVRHPDFGSLREADKRDALAGDLIIKLATYLEDPARDPSATSVRLGRVESNNNLAVVYDTWAAAGDEATKPYGLYLGEERKAMIVEATLWRRFGSRILAPHAAVTLAEVMETVDPPVRE